MFTQPSKVEAYALAGSSLYGVFGHMEGLHGQRRFIKDIFPNIKRLYLFSLAWQQDGTNMHDQLDSVAAYFDAVTGVKLIVNIVIQGAEPADWCATEASVYGYPNGTMVIKSVVVDQMHGQQDVLAMMLRIVDDIDAEWAPEAFTGNYWPPLTRPRYTVGVPTRFSLKRAGIELPSRCK